VSQAVFSATKASGVNSKIAARWVDDDFAASFDGATTLTDTSGTVPDDIAVLHFGNAGGVLMPIRISHLSIGPYASPLGTSWTDAQLAEISGA
jgi:hypothetical protein